MYLCKMESTRQKKISRLLQKDLAIIFQMDAPAILGSFMLTITGVRVSPDLSVAKVYLSIFPSDNSKKLIEQVKEKSPFFFNKHCKDTWTLRCLLKQTLNTPSSLTEAEVLNPTILPLIALVIPMRRMSTKKMSGFVPH